MADRVNCFVFFCLFRLLLPAVLVTAAALRYNGLSFMHLVCLLVVPFMKIPSKSSMAGATGRFLKVLVALSTLPVVAHAAFHITLIAIATDSEPYGSMLPNCSVNERIARQIGFQRLDGVPTKHAVRLILPDVVVWITSILVLVICNILVRRIPIEFEVPSVLQARQKRMQKMAYLLDYVGEFFAGLCLAITSIMVPSVLSSVYFLVFLVIAILWACYKNIAVGFARFRIVLLVYTAAHIMVLHLYQFQFFQEALNKDTLIARLLGLTGVIYTDCSKVYSIQIYPDVRWWHYVNPGVLLVLYWELANETRYWFKTKGALKDGQVSISLLPKKRLKKRAKNSRRSTERQVQQLNADMDETGSLVFSGSAYGDEGDDERLVEASDENVNYNTLDVPMNPELSDVSPQASRLEEGTRPHKVGAHNRRSQKVSEETKRAPLVSVFVFIMKQSYVLMLISMMSWSIMYVSWLTFALLIGACLLWMLPNSRRACLVTSPVLVLYVVGLVMAQYVFNMNLTAELPTKAGIIPISQIGLKRFDTPPKDLGFHLIFTMFFLMTLRQFMRERRSSQDLTDEDLALETRQNGTQFTGGLGNLISHFLMEVMCKYSIFICAGMLLLIAVQEVVIYRVIYMILFLIFIICFQVSYTLWRTLMFVFWWTVIIYSMAVLIIIYTYQFEQFPEYWRNNTGWNDTVLSDIGLQIFNGTELFIKLLTPTSFLIVIILQVHYFHKPFLGLSALDRYKNEDCPENNGHWMESICNTATSDWETDMDDDTLSVKPSYQARFVSFLHHKHVLSLMRSGWQTLTFFLWRIAEIHMFKVVVLIIMYVTLQKDEVSAFTAIYAILVAVLVPFMLNKAHLLLSHLVLIWTCVVILIKMLYQLKQVPVWEDFQCNRTDNGSTAGYPGKSLYPVVWFGLQKQDIVGKSIAIYIKHYILILGTVIFETIVRYHQTQAYSATDVTKPKEGIIFHNVTRDDADKGLLECIKYFANYAFYKFGLEVRQANISV